MSFMSSMAAHVTLVGETIYGATKAAITNFAKGFRNEYEGVFRVSIVHSWGVNTFGADELEVQNKLLSPDKIAEMVEFIITRSPEYVIESVELGVIGQWHGGMAPWSPE